MAEPGLRVAHHRHSRAPAERLWHSARAVRLADTALLGRLVSWRLPGTRPELTFDELFRSPPFAVLEQAQTMLASGLVGRTWTLRRDYPQMEDAEQFRRFAQRGTARVMFAHWVEPGIEGGSALLTEVGWRRSEHRGGSACGRSGRWSAPFTA